MILSKTRHFITAFLIFHLVASLNSSVPESSRDLGPVHNEYKSHPYNDLYQDIIDKYVKKGLPGMAMLIRTPEEGTWIGIGGYARLEDKTPITSENLFHSASVGKFYTATAVMILKDDGLIDLDATIDTYLPDKICDRVANGHSATVRHLATHRSGIPEGRDQGEKRNDPLRESTWQKYLESVYDLPAKFAPGTRFDYQNINYVLLAVIMDQITGSHAGFFSTRIFQQANLGNTYYKNEPGLPHPPGLVDTYMDRFGDGYLENITEMIDVIVQNEDYGDAGIIASMSDYARFIEAVMGGELISQESLTEMTTPSDAAGWYCIGGEIRNSPDDDLFGHAHGTQGRGKMGIADMYHFPDSGVTICYAANLASHNPIPPLLAYEEIWEEVTYAVFYGRGQTDSRKEPEKNPVKKKVAKQ